MKGDIVMKDNKKNQKQDENSQMSEQELENVSGGAFVDPRKRLISRADLLAAVQREKIIAVRRIIELD